MRLCESLASCYLFLLCLDITESATAAASDEFPTPESLRAANIGYKQRKTVKDANGRIVPSPAVRTKQQIFRLSDYEAIDARARQVRI